MIPLKENHIEKASEMCGRAFLYEPFYAAVFPEEKSRYKKIRNFFRFRIKYGLTYGKVFASSEKIEGIAIWLPMEKPGMPFHQMVKCGGLMLGFSIGFSSVLKLMEIEKHIAANHAASITGFHYHLSPIAVDPEFQGKGYASQLMRPLLKVFDKEMTACFLETQSPQNVDIYEHLGFTISVKSVIPKINIQNWSMIRLPHSIRL